MFSSKNSNAFTFTLKHAKSITSKDIILEGSAKIFSNLTHLKVNNEMEIVVIVAKNCGVTISPDAINFAGT